jgi:hypothetical protein
MKSFYGPSVLRDAPKFLRELQLRELLLQGHCNIVPRLKLAQPLRERAFEIARVGAPVEVRRLGLDD